MEADGEIIKEIIKNCSSLIFSRCSPSQKALIVVKTCESTGYTGAAIGDGVNDIDMLLKADLSFGIEGKEGKQASIAAAIKLTTFNQIVQVILGHGYALTPRYQIMMKFLLYKNSLLVFCSVYFFIHAGVIPIMPFNEKALMLNNIFFTVIPLASFAFFNKRHTTEELLKYPELYKISERRSRYFSFNLSQWLLNSIYHSLIIFFAVFYAFYPEKAGNFQLNI